MSRTVSISKANKLGDRLRKSEVPSEEDLRLLQEVLADHAGPMDTVQHTLKGLGLQSTARFKTSGTIIDKLKRDATRLGKMQDLAGARVVQDISLHEQDSIVDQIVEAFPEAKAVDLRPKSRSKSGYRAVHVIAPVDDCSVEIQVRTEMQDLWANLIESFEGEMGRDIRYGGKPLHPRRRVPGRLMGQSKPPPTQTQMFAALLQMSGFVVILEEQKERLRQERAKAAELQRRIAGTEKQVKSLFKRVLDERGKGP
jgi:hypothetical protein